jgi:hypothetical protein
MRRAALGAGRGRAGHGHRCGGVDCAAVAIEVERTVTETTAPQATLEPPAGASTSGEDVVMEPADDGSVPPPSAGEHDTATSVAPESSTAAGAASVKGATDLSSSQYVDFPGIGTIDLDAAELPSNDREMLEVAMEQMFADPSILDTIASATSVLCQTRVLAAQRPPPRRRRRRGLSGSPRSARSRT